jgi:hypothetical protein
MVVMLEDVDTGAVTTYLRSLGWLAERQDSRRSIWRHESGARVFVPGQRGPDYGQLMEMAVREIALVEHRDRDDIAVDLAWRAFDKLHVRRASRATALPMAAALDLHEALERLIVAAARATADRRRPSYSGRLSQRVETIIDEVQMLPSLAGSFIVRALLPVDALAAAQPALPGFPEPAQRRVAATIATAARTAVSTARQVATGAPLERWDDAVEDGVSANLCDALARLTGEGDSAADVDIRVEWTWDAPRAEAPLVVVNAGLAPVLDAGADYLRGEPEEHVILLTGLVTKLHREAATGPGEVTVRGLIENWDVGNRTLRVELDETTYREAITAHDLGKFVRARALVERTPRGLDVLRVEDFQALT